MTFQQLQAVKRWHLEHKDQHPLEYHVWDLVLTAWVLGWAGMPATLLLWWPGVSALCVLLYFTPRLYVGLRRWLHLRGRLRCDWLESLSA